MNKDYTIRWAPESFNVELNSSHWCIIKHKNDPLDSVPLTAFISVWILKWLVEVKMGWDGEVMCNISNLC